MFNYGGPGQSGIDHLRDTYGRLPQTVRERFDVVTFDPRGTGSSRPIDCVDDAFLDQSATLAAVPGTTEQLDAVHQWSAQFAAGCAQRMGAYAGQVGTRNVARDMEAIAATGCHVHGDLDELLPGSEAFEDDQEATRQVAQADLLNAAIDALVTLAQTRPSGSKVT